MSHRDLDFIISESPSPARPGVPDLARMAESRLHASGDPALHALRCSQRGGILRLAGTLADHRQLWAALSLVAAVEGVRGIDNAIEIRSRLSPAPCPAPAGIV